MAKAMHPARRLTHVTGPAQDESSMAGYGQDDLVWELYGRWGDSEPARTRRKRSRRDETECGKASLMGSQNRDSEDGLQATVASLRAKLGRRDSRAWRGSGRT